MTQNVEFLSNSLGHNEREDKVDYSELKNLLPDIVVLDYPMKDQLIMITSMIAVI